MQASAKSITRQHAANKQIEEATNPMKKHINLELKQSHQYSNKICLLPYPTDDNGRTKNIFHHSIKSLWSN